MRLRLFTTIFAFFTATVMATAGTSALAALIDESACYGAMDCYTSIGQWQNPFEKNLQSGYADMGQQLMAEPELGTSSRSRRSRVSAQDSWLESADTALDPALDETQSDRLEFDPEVVAFITDFQKESFNTPAQNNYARFNYDKTSGFKQIRLSQEDMDHVRDIVSSSSASRGSSDVLSAGNPKAKRPPVKPVDSGPFSLQMIIIFHIALFVIAFIVFKLDRA